MIVLSRGLVDYLSASSSLLVSFKIDVESLCVSKIAYMSTSSLGLLVDDSKTGTIIEVLLETP